MKNQAVILFVLLVFGLDSNSQDVKELIIARTTDSLWVDDTTEIRIMGFTRKLSEPSTIPGPLLVYEEGDSVEIDLWNVSQGASHTIHLHGLDVNQQNDGVPMLSFEVAHMEHGFYRFIAPHPGTYLYHCHVISSFHVQAGMYGMLVVKPKNYDKLTWNGGFEFMVENNLIMSEVDTDWHSDTLFNHPHDTGFHRFKLPKYKPEHFLANFYLEEYYGQEEQGQLNGWYGGENLLRVANIGNQANRFIFPTRLNARIISSDGRPLPEINQSDTLYVFPGERYQVLFEGVYSPDSLIVDYLDLNTLNTSHRKIIGINTFWTSINEFQLNNGIKLFPNPAKNYLKVDFEKEIPNEIRILTIDGKLIQILANQKVNKFNKFDVSKLSNGLYQIQFRFKEKVLTEKIIIQHEN